MGPSTINLKEGTHRARDVWYALMGCSSENQKFLK